MIALFKSFKCEELRLPDPAMVLEVSWLVTSMLIKEPGCQTSSRLTEKLGKVQKSTRAPYYMATPEESK